MLKRRWTMVIFLFLFFFADLSASENVIHHKLSLSIDPAEHFIDVSDRMILPEGILSQPLTFLLLSDLEVESMTPGVTFELEGRGGADDIGMDRENFDRPGFTKNRYKILIDDMPSGDLVIDLAFSGSINYPIKQRGSEYARGFSRTPGIISDKGVYLSGSTFWVPSFGNRLVTFELTASVPDGWDVVSQGAGMPCENKDGRTVVRWDCMKPMEEIYLISAEFCKYSRTAGGVALMAFLRTRDENLALKYMDTTERYMKMYSELIGPYPYSKFALVENFWETGYGMPSFTLLGEKVIRFPFILHSSYPHELLHNWWGNSVYVDFANGNWCEGLTVYMADHLIKQQRGLGARYRREKLQRYTDYVSRGNDFPLSSFTSRSDAASEAVGYGKGMMMWHMLRQNIGDELFIEGVRAFYRRGKFKYASFDDIQKAFESVTDKDLEYFFRQWVTGTGAPKLSLAGVKARHKGEDYNIEIKLKQRQEGEAYILDIPVAISFKERVEIKKVRMSRKEEVFRYTFKDRPLYLRVDPSFDLFRELGYNEIPPSLSSAYGSENILVILPSGADHEDLENYNNLAGLWAEDSSLNIEITDDDQVDELPPDRAVWIFGVNNSCRDFVQTALEEYDAEISEETVKIGGMKFGCNSNSFVISVRHPRNPAISVVWLTVAESGAVEGLARKLPHYGKYSYLVFEGVQPTNIAKGSWDVVDTPMASEISWDGDHKGKGFAVKLPERKALAELAPAFSAERMKRDIEYLASDELEGRGLGSEGIRKASVYIAERFEEAGLSPAGDDGTFFQTFEGVIDAGGKTGKIRNIIGFLPGANEGLEKESVVICAHYDHLGYGWPDVRKGNEGMIHNGADDNASGVAVMLELARRLGESFKPGRSIVFAAFTAEENGLLGSRHYVANMKQFPAEKCAGVLNLDTVGRLRDGKLLVLGSSSAREWKHIFMGCGYVTGVEAEMVSKDLDASDQVSFLKAGVPAVQIFSGPHGDYHRPTDTAEKIDYAGLVKVAAFTREAVIYLTERENRLLFSGGKKQDAKRRHSGGKRAVSTGCMPDFTFKGDGVRVAGVSVDSPAAEAGMKQGDVIILIGGIRVADLREYSAELKKYKPGDAVEITFIRKGRKITKTIVLSER
ncbi:MAG: M20/M25/M40 family metallo-hydrolase [Candidatus Krumholzibacteriota bacterium]|nr:M20/M25/M40 family metallo-hydrolase [Candidatus Krumholzibacteriota bacterium]